MNSARLLALLLCGATAPALAADIGIPSAVVKPETPVLRVIVLGSGTPMPSRKQAGTSILIQAGGRNLLFDCGRGCTTRLAQYDPDLPNKVDMLFLTHLHSDHIVGIPDLWLNGWTLGRKRPLEIWGPGGTRAMMKGLRRAYSADIAYRTKPGAGDAAGPTWQAHEISSDGVVYEAGELKVTAFRVLHADIPAYGYRVDFNGKSVFLSGDTTATPNLVRYGKGADVALMEVASPAMVDYVRRSFPPPQADRILALHMTADQAGAIFAAMRPGLGVYYHMVRNCAADEALRQKSRERYNGRLEISQDLMTMEVFADHIETRLPEDAERCGG